MRLLCLNPGRKQNEKAEFGDRREKHIWQRTRFKVEQNNITSSRLVILLRFTVQLIKVGLRQCQVSMRRPSACVRQGDEISVWPPRWMPYPFSHKFFPYERGKRCSHSFHFLEFRLNSTKLLHWAHVIDIFIFKLLSHCRRWDDSSPGALFKG